MSTIQRYKYPRTSHLPWSKGRTDDDLYQLNLAIKPTEEIVITEKLDGENTSMYQDGIHARSIDSKHHPSRTWVKSLQGRIGHLIPPELRLCGENMYAKHSIAYQELESYFYLFSIWEGDLCLAWDETLEWAELLDLHVVPELYRGFLADVDLRNVHKTLNLEHQEGFVIRPTRSIKRSEFSDYVLKWVRPSHVQTDQHWMHQAVVPNQLKKTHT